MLFLLYLFEKLNRNFRIRVIINAGGINIKYLETDGDDNIKIIKFYSYILCLTFYCTMLSGMSEFPTHHFFI